MLIYLDQERGLQINRITEIEKKAEIIQGYFNKIGITKIKDLSNYEGGGGKGDTGLNAFGSYRTSVESLTSIDQSRMMRYRQYEQMCYVPELNGGLELYADDGSLYNENDEVIKVEADNQEITESLTSLWFKSLDMNSVLWHIVYNTCKYGDSFYEVIPDSFKNPKKVKFLRFIPPQFVSRIEKDGNLLEFVVRIPEDVTSGGSTSYTTTQAQEVKLKPWQIVHFKLDDKEFEPYGKSVLEPGRLAFKQMKLIEDAMLIYRISRAPERRVFSIPVGNLPYREAMARVEDFKQKYRKTPWIDPISGEIGYKANPLCITLDTKIDLLDGRSLELSKLIEEYKSGKENWVYSIDTKRNNKVVPGKIEWAGVTRKNAELVEVTIDNGKSVRCTPDHKFMLRDGTYKQAKDLVPGESLMPKYTKLCKIANSKDYMKIYDPSSDKYKYIHSLVAEEIQPELWNNDWTFRITHHKDFNKLNNSPNNLVIMERNEHNRYHLDLLNKLWSDEEYRTKQIASRVAAWKDDDERKKMQSNLMIKYNKSDKHRQTTTDRNNKFWSDADNKEKTSAKMRKPKSTTEKMHIKFDDKFWNHVDITIKQLNTQTKVVESLNSNEKFIEHFVTITPRSNRQIHRHLLTKAFRSKGFETFEEYSAFVKSNKNHKVVSVKFLKIKEDTGCITVTEWHNFSILNSIYIKNSINDDFFLPKRPDGSGVTIDYLPGGQQLGEIDDVRYFKEKILRTMRIPIAYLTGELQGDVARTSLAAMDVRFAKTIERVQKMIIKGLEKIAIVELAFKRFTIEDLHSFVIKLTPPSKIYEMQELETTTQKLNVIQTAIGLADSAGKLYLPREWLYKNISKFNEQEISAIKLMQQAEAAEAAEAQAAQGAGGGLESMGAPAGGGGGGMGGTGGMEMGAEAGGVAGGGEMGMAPPEAGAMPPETTPAPGGGEAELALASKILNIAGKDFLLENENDIREIIKFVKNYKETDKITKDKPIIVPKKKMYENNFHYLFVIGELKGLISRNTKNKQEMLED